jgi:hypothetical protein
MFLVMVHGLPVECILAWISELCGLMYIHEHCNWDVTKICATGLQLSFYMHQRKSSCSCMKLLVRPVCGKRRHLDLIFRVL